MILVAAACGLLLLPAGARGYSLDAELRNFAKNFERELYVTLTPDFQIQLLEQGLNALADRTTQLVGDPERLPANLCGIKGMECAGDVRFRDWPDKTDGIRKPVLFTGRSGATLSGHVWATRNGPAARPGIVITTGSVQAPEELYWGQAATLAKHGYVVLTYDVQGQGASDTLGEAPDTFEGVPSQGGQPFFDGTEDALDFLLSTPGSKYVPRASCTSGTSHAPKQDRRVSEGRNAAFNPLGDLVDSSRIGIAGHSLGASAVSFVGQKDPRVDAIVAWDNLRGGDGSVTAGSECDTAAQTREPAPLAKPAIGISNDYGIVPTPNFDDPDPESRNGAFANYKAAGTDSAQVSIRGGCHEESAFIPGMVTGVYPLACGTLRGGDLVAWYTTAWFDKYVKGDPGADARLLTTRWHDDAPGKAVDLSGDGNLFSFYLNSRYDVTLAGGGDAVCDDMRNGCPGMGPDGGPVPYDFVADAHSPAAGASGGAPAGAAPLGSVAAATSPQAAATRRSIAKALRKCKRKRSAKSRRRCVKRAVRRA